MAQFIIIFFSLFDQRSRTQLFLLILTLMSKYEEAHQSILEPLFNEFPRNFCQIYKIGFNIVYTKFPQHEIKNFIVNTLPQFLS